MKGLAVDHQGVALCQAHSLVVKKGLTVPGAVDSEGDLHVNHHSKSPWPQGGAER